MSTDWGDGAQDSLAGTPRFDQATGSNPTLVLDRVSLEGGVGGSTSYEEWVAADLDGPVRFGMREPMPNANPTCIAVAEHIRSGRIVLGLWGDGTTPIANASADGALVVDLTNGVPQLVYQDNDPGLNGWSIGSGWVDRMAYGADFLRNASDGSWLTLHTTADDPDGLGRTGKLLIDGSNVIFEVGDYTGNALVSFDPVHGTRSLVRFLHDSTRGAANIGTDGVDLVWSLGENRPPGQPIYPTRSIYTAPYTSDPSALIPRRLRSDAGGLFGLEEGQFAVGYGYAGRQLSDGKSVEIVRVADGAGWNLVGTTAWRWNRVMGFTQSEAIILVLDTTQQKQTVARVRLDSLGPSLPLD